MWEKSARLVKTPTGQASRVGARMVRPRGVSWAGISSAAPPLRARAAGSAATLPRLPPAADRPRTALFRSRKTGGRSRAVTGALRETISGSVGDADGTVDLAWNPIRRGLQNFLIELTEDPAGQTGWRFALNSRKSTATIKGLVSGKRYWFRVTAEGAAGSGPASNPATKVAP